MGFKLGEREIGGGVGQGGFAPWSFAGFGSNKTPDKCSFSGNCRQSIWNGMGRRGYSLKMLELRTNCDRRLHKVLQAVIVGSIQEVGE